MGAPRRLILLRHGQTEFNATNRMQGQLDIPLTDLGRLQAAAVAPVLAKQEPGRIISSDLSRAFDTAVALSEACGTPVQADVRLRETDIGEWQGKSHAEVDSQNPGAREAWRLSSSYAPPGGESFRQVAARAGQVVEQLFADAAWAERPAVLVAHGGCINALTSSLLGLLDHQPWPVFGGLGNCSWVQLSFFPHDDTAVTPANGQWRLDIWNAAAAVVGDVV